MEWVAISFSRGSSWSRDGTCISSIPGRFFTTEPPGKPAAAAKSLQMCPTLCNPIDGSPTGSSVPGILQARTLEWVAIPFSSAWKWKVKSESEVAQLCPTLSDPMACSLPGSTGFSRQECWSGLSFSAPILGSLAGSKYSITGRR